MLGFCDPMPTTPPRLDRASDGMNIWILGPEATGDFAASAYDRIINGNLGGRPASVDGETARKVIEGAVTLAREFPVLHDISLGGIAVALCEIAFASDIGFHLDDIDSRELLDETPLRFLAVAYDGELDTGLRHSKIGVFTGDILDFGNVGSMPLSEAKAIWNDALPRRMQ